MWGSAQGSGLAAPDSGVRAHRSGLIPGLAWIGIGVGRMAWVRWCWRVVALDGGNRALCQENLKLRCWERIQQLSRGDEEHTQALRSVEEELWDGRGWRRATKTAEWVQRNKSSQQRYFSHHGETRDVFDQEALAFEANVQAAISMVDEFIDADVLPVSKWALDLMEEARRVRKEQAEFASAGPTWARSEDGQEPSAQSHEDLDPADANETYHQWAARRWRKPREKGYLP